jgi:hypothetical protein
MVTLGQFHIQPSETNLAFDAHTLGSSRSRGRPMRRAFTFSLTISCLVSAYGTVQQTPIPKTLTAEEALAISSRVVDCEWKAADRYDNGRSTVSELVQRIMGICAVELTKTRLAFHVSLNDPEIDLIEFKQAVESVENARKNGVGPPIKERL